MKNIKVLSFPKFVIGNLNLRKKAEWILKQVQDDVAEVPDNDVRVRQYKSAFTLIELLVVVLIIGILSAIALPQYQRAVEKARFTQYRVLADSLVSAVQSYYLANSEWPADLSDLDVQLLAGMTDKSISNGSCKQTDKLFCCLAKPVSGTQDGSVSCGKIDLSLIYEREYAWANGTNKTKMSCYEKSGTKVCSSMGTKVADSLTLVTPNGFISGYAGYGL